MRFYTHEHRFYAGVDLHASRANASNLLYVADSNKDFLEKRGA
jgi:hypothetical protein